MSELLRWCGIINPPKFAYGYFDSPEQESPAFDPGHVACPVCNTQTNSSDCKTISMASLDGAEKSYFYRTHKSCYDSLSDSDKQNLDDLVWTMINGGSGWPG